MSFQLIKVILVSDLIINREANFALHFYFKYWIYTQNNLFCGK